MQNNNELKEIIDEIEVLINHHVDADAPAFTAWHLKARRYLVKKFGEKSIEYNAFIKIHFSVFVFSDTTKSEFIYACKQGLLKAREMLKLYVNDENEKIANIKEKNDKSYNKVFIVHGHDDALRQKLARVIEKQGIEPIILSEQTNQGKTIIEKFEEYSNVSAAICLYTKDDCMNEKEKIYRARQNVVFETGYFMGKNGRKNVIILSNSEIEMPSDLSGVIYANNKNWELDVLKELKVIGYNIDLNKIIE